ncbi:MAG: redoxin domain-containing protein [Acidobacteriota bacterium]|jgi:hypothetical protein|nr:redoxin domain-containing protein [Acidobacteriota bacterium]
MGRARAGSPGRGKAVAWMRRLLAGAALASGIVAAGYLLQAEIRPAARRPPARLKQPLPPLVVNRDGVDVQLADLIRGKRSVVVFHSRSCGVCREMMPALDPFPPELRLVLVRSEKEEARAAGGVPPGIYWDRHGAFSRTFIALPTILFVDEKGILESGITGRRSRAFVRERLERFAAGGPPPGRS